MKIEKLPAAPDDRTWSKINELIEAHNQSQEQGEKCTGKHYHACRCFLKEDCTWIKCTHHTACQEQEAWEPGERYYYFDSQGEIQSGLISGDADLRQVDNNRRDYTGIFRTEAEAQERLKQIKSFIQTLK